MSHLHWFLAILSAAAWIGIVVTYFSEQIVRGVTNRFTRPKTFGDLSPEQKAELDKPIFERTTES